MDGAGETHIDARSSHSWNIPHLIRISEGWMLDMKRRILSHFQLNMPVGFPDGTRGPAREATSSTLYHNTTSLLDVHRFY